VTNGSQITESDGGDAGERGMGAEGVLEQEDKVLGLVPYKEPVNFFSSFFNIFYFNEFCRTRFFNF
jgi:hypothetical protein